MFGHIPVAGAAGKRSRRLRAALVVAILIYLFGGCASTVRMYTGPERPEEQIAILWLTGGIDSVRIEPSGRIEWVGFVPQDAVEILLTLGGGGMTGTHHLYSAVVDAVDGERVSFGILGRPEIHMLPGVRNVQGTIPMTSKSFTLSFEAEPGHRYLIGALQRIGDKVPCYQPIVVDVEETFGFMGSGYKGHVRYTAPIVSCGD